MNHFAFLLETQNNFLLKSPDIMSSDSKRIEVTYGSDMKAFRFVSPFSLESQLRASFQLGSVVSFELFDDTKAIVPLADLENGGKYTLARTSGNDWSTRPMWQTKDSVHGLICLPDTCLRFIDTPEFQRLRDLKQMGSCQLVYMGGHNTRFDHSVGVAYLAFRMVSSISERQPELGISSRDILCVTVAALCHDLGHGPGSHMWDSSVLKKLGVDMSHEDMSLMIFDYIVQSGRDKWTQQQKPEDPFDGLTDDDLMFIKALIHPPKDSYTSLNIGRMPEKFFLMDIVSNKASGLDVDKFDYIMRDTYNTGVRGVFDVDRLIRNVVVKECDGRLQMCWPQKELEGIIEIFHTRDSLHRRVYQHRTNTSIESMFRDAALLAGPAIQIRDPVSGKWLSFTEAQTSVGTFTKVSDWLFKLIRFGQDFKVDWSDPRVGQARQLLEDIECRRIWKFVGALFGKVENYETVKQELEKCSQGYIAAEQWELKTAMFSWGKGDKNPLENVPFIRKNDEEPMKPKPEDLSRVFVPASFREHVLYVYVKSQDDEIRELAKTAFSLWCTERGIENSLVDMSSVTLSKQKRSSRVLSRRLSASAPVTPRISKKSLSPSSSSKKRK